MRAALVGRVSAWTSAWPDDGGFAVVLIGMFLWGADGVNGHGCDALRFAYRRILVLTTARLVYAVTLATSLSMQT
jgi:hypothetical protein